MDGFEHAIQWILGENADLLELDYRPDAGMESVRRYYYWRPLEKKKLLETFEKHFAAKSQDAKQTLQRSRGSPRTKYRRTNVY